MTTQMKLMSSTYQQYCSVSFFSLYSVVLTVESVDETLKCDHSNDSYKPVFHAVKPFANFPQKFQIHTTGLLE